LKFLEAFRNGSLMNLKAGDLKKFLDRNNLAYAGNKANLVAIVQ
jgi:hypothetical protein